MKASAKLVSKKLTDGSEVYAVRIADDTDDDVIMIHVHSEDAGRLLRLALNLATVSVDVVVEYDTNKRITELEAMLSSAIRFMETNLRAEVPDDMPEAAVDELVRGTTTLRMVEADRKEQTLKTIASFNIAQARTLLKGTVQA